MESPTSPSSEKEATPAIESMTPEKTDKSHSFRKRRLTLARHQLGVAVASDASEEASPRPRKAARTESSSTPQKETLKSRVLHAGEIMRRFSSPSSTPNHRLYKGPFAPAEVEQKDNVRPAWKKRHLSKGKDTLPFPGDIVATFSCHGIEPVYDSEYEKEPDEEEEEEDDDWIPVGEKVFRVNTEEKDSTEGDDDEEEEQPSTTAKINQDRACVVFPYGNSSRTALFGVFDGHGQGGELVSQYAVHEVPRRLELHANFKDNIENAFKETFDAVDNALEDEALIQPIYAGTTACVALLRDNILSIANTGDSRAVLGKRGTNTQGRTVWTSQDLTVDQNPDLPEEQSRIEGAGGFVSAPPEEGLSARVWLDCAHSMIGLAMSRSIGDHAVKEVGVIAEPVVTTHSVSSQDDLLIVATDGVWEFVSSQEAVDIVSDSLEAGGGSTKACQKLIEAAAAKWHEEEGSYRDDITAVVVRLQELWKNPIVQNSKQEDEEH